MITEPRIEMRPERPCWIAAQEEQPIAHASEAGEVFTARYETFLFDAGAEPDRRKWLVEVAIQLRG